METISLKEVLAIMDKKQMFSIAFVTLDKKKKTGGEWIELPKCVKHNQRSAVSSQQSGEPEKQNRIYKNPQHYNNSTRNLRNCMNGDLVKIHLRLIRRFNNKVVV